GESKLEAGIQQELERWLRSETCEQSNQAVRELFLLSLLQCHQIRGGPFHSGVPVSLHLFQYRPGLFSRHECFCRSSSHKLAADLRKLHVRRHPCPQVS